MAIILLKAGDISIAAEVLERNVFPSQSTGKQLIRLQVHFERLNSADMDAVKAFIESGQFVQTDWDNPSKERRWKIDKHSNSYTEGAPQTRFWLELLEVEDIKISKLVIAGSEYTPYKYNEDFNNEGRLTIDARVELSETEHEEIRELKPYFSVVRKGVNDTPREMRFGQMLWSKKDDKYRMNFILVDRSHDKPGDRGLFEPQLGNIEDTAAACITTIRSLLNKLAEKGVLSASERNAISVVNQTETRKQMWEFDRVEDLDEWFDK